MEPVEIVGVVAASLQFLEFGFKLVTKTTQIKGSSSGLTDENANLLDIANDLDKYADLMNKRWRDYSGKRPLGDNEMFLGEAIKDCQQISNEMQQEIRKRSLKGRSTWGALLQALETTTKNNYVNVLAERLEAAKEKITRANLACILDDSERSKLSLNHVQHQLEHLTRSVQTVSSQFEKSLGVGDIGNDGSTEALEIPSRTVQTTWGAIDSNSPILNALFEELVDKIWNLSWDANSAKNKDEYPATFLDNFKQQIIQSLQFDDIQKREEEIREAFEATFEWIWETDPPEDHGNPAWSSFPNWLERDEENLYWITGVPGAGKSTLMKYIQHDSKDRLVRHLAKWEPDSSLLLLHYYAWNAGMDELKSCEGLLRTILAQALEAEPDITPSVAKRRLALFGTLSPNALRDFQMLPQKPWSLDELQECLKSFLQELDCRKKLVIFVDGLDEFETPPQQVVAQIQALRIEKRAKICVASRPWIEFEQALMPSYIKGKLEILPEFLEREFEVSDLTKQIREKAQGVFLWVTLVVEHMPPGLEGAKSLAALQQAIDELPTEVKKLYDVIWTRIPKELKEDASKLVWLFCAIDSEKDMLRMWLAYEGKTPSYKFEPQDDWKAAVRSITIRRLNSHARGILTLSDRDEVTVPHKTAYEWMLQTGVRDEISSSIPQLYNPALRWMSASIIASTYYADDLGAKLLRDAFLRDALTYACTTCSPDTNYRKDAELDIAPADDIIQCFNEFANIAKPWKTLQKTLQFSAYSRMKTIQCPNFICLVARLGVVDYFRSLKQSDPGLFLKSVNSEEKGLGGLAGFESLVSLFPLPYLMADAYNWAKLECMKLFLGEIPEKSSQAYMAILKCGLVAKHQQQDYDNSAQRKYYNEVWEHVQQCAEERGFSKRLKRDLKRSEGRRAWFRFGIPLSSRRRHLLSNWH